MTMKACHAALGVPELLSRILIFTVPIWREDNRKFQFYNRVLSTSTDPPWPFLMVCKHWRNVVLSTSYLWSSFNIELRSFSYEDAIYLPALLGAYLHRSKTAPLTLSILFSLTPPMLRVTEDFEEHDPSDIVRGLLNGVLECQKRWEDVVLEVWTTVPHGSDISRIVPVDFTLRLSEMGFLKDLKITNFVSSDFPGTRQIELGRCVQLETLALIGTIPLEDSCSSGSSQQGVEDAELVDYFPKLLTAQLWRFTHGNCWKFLQHARHVKNLELSFSVRFEAHQEPQTMVHLPQLRLPRLRSLDLRLDAEDVDGMHVLQYIISPCLTELKLGNLSFSNQTFLDLALVLDGFRLANLELFFFTPESWSEQVILMDVFIDFLQSSGLREVQCLTIDNPYYAFSGGPSPSVANLLANTFRTQSPSKGHLPHLTFLHLKINYFELHQGPSMGCFVKDLILACHMRYSSQFILAIVFKMSSEYGELDDEAKRRLSSDPEILACITENFEVSINGVKCVDTLHSDQEGD